MIVAFSGWRKWPDQRIPYAVLEQLVCGSQDHITIRVGDCPTGLDHMIREWCRAWTAPHQVYWADWEQWGKAAGPLRNREMLRGKPDEERADLLLAFPEPGKYPKIPGSGTWGCIGEAAALAIPTIVYPLKYPVASPILTAWELRR